MTDKRSRAEQTQGRTSKKATHTDISLLCHWQIPPWRTWKARLNHRKANAGKILLRWEMTQKSRYRGNTRQNRHRSMLMGKILKWDIGKRSKNKKQNRKKHAGHGTNRMIGMSPWTVLPWELN